MTPEERREALRRKLYDGRSVERGDMDGFGNVTGLDLGAPIESARRAIDVANRQGRLPAHAAEKLESVVRRDRGGQESAAIAAGLDPNAEAAFAKLLSYGLRGRLDTAYLSDKERDAHIRFERLANQPLNIGTPGDGGYAIPFTLDPSVMLGNAGTQNVLRNYARNITITGSNTWKGVSSDGATADFDAELTEVAANDLDLAQPEIAVEKAQAYIEFSIEVAEDWGGLRDELVVMLNDARDRLEADAFINGSGTNEPKGILAALAASEFETASSGTVVLNDIYDVKADLGQRFRPNAAWYMNDTTRDSLGRLISVADSSEPAIFSSNSPQGRGDDLLLRKPVREVPDIDDVAAGAVIAVYGDLARAFVIVDRVGMRIELLPHVFDTANNRPKGARAVYAYWRVGSGALVPDAVRLLKVKS